MQVRSMKLILCLTIIIVMLDSSALAAKDKNKKGRQALKINPDIKAQEERVLAEKRVKDEKERQIQQARAEYLAGEDRKREERANRKTLGENQKFDETSSSSSSLPSSLTPWLSHKDSKEYREWYEVATRCPECVDSSTLEHALQLFWQQDLFGAYACACQFLLSSPQDKMAQAIRYVATESRFAVINLPIHFDAPQAQALDFLTSWEILGPFPAGKLELDADPALSTPVNESAVEWSMHRGSKGLSQPQMLYSVLRPPNPCMDVGANVGAPGVCSWHTGSYHSRHASSSSATDTQYMEGGMDMYGGVEDAQMGALPSPDVPHPHREGPKRRAQSGQEQEQEQGQGDGRANIMPRATGDIALTLLTLPTSETFFSEYVNGATVKWRQVRANRQTGRVPHVELSWRKADFNAHVQALGRLEAVEYQGWARGVTYVQRAGQYLTSCRGVHTFYVRNDNMTHVVAGDVYGAGMGEGSTVMSTAIHMQPGPVGFVLPLRGAGHQRFTCRLAFLPMRDDSNANGEWEPDLQQQQDQARQRQQPSMGVAAVAEAILHEQQRKQAEGQARRSYTKNLQRTLDPSPRDRQQELRVVLTTPLSDLVTGKYSADASALLDAGHATWGDGSAEGSCAGWPQGQRFYAPSLEATGVLEPGIGLMLSPYFSLRITNAAQHPLSLSFSLWVPGALADQGIFRAMASRQRPGEDGGEDRRDEEVPQQRHRGKTPQGMARSDGMIFGRLGIAPLQRWSKTKDVESYRVTIAPGQTSQVPLEFTVADEQHLPYLPCHDFRVKVEVVSDHGDRETIPMHVKCRHANETLLLNFPDRGGSISQAAVILPLSSPRTAKSHMGILVDNGVGSTKECLSPAAYAERLTDEKQKFGKTTLIEGRTPGTLDATGNAGCHLHPYPALLALHGTGVHPRDFADAFKEVPRKQSARPASVGWENGAYRFGVEGMWVVAPSKHGAHNWEYVGEEAADEALAAVSRLLARTPLLPQLDTGVVAVAGHSMGGHGALVWATRHPSRTVCLAVMAGWLSKETYGPSNSFMSPVDAQTALPGAATAGARIFEAGLLDQRPELHLANLGRRIPVHIRVGANDQTTPPWHSRRLYRRLISEGVNVSLEEVPNQEHWWWDTVKANDGGVVNDVRMRSFYSECFLHAVEAQARAGRISLPTAASIVATSAMDSATSSDDTYTPSRYLQDRGCGSGFKLSLHSPATQEGLCGVHVLQQRETGQHSSVDVVCVEGSHYPEGRLPLLAPEAYIKHGGPASMVPPPYYDLDRRRCFLKTKNVRRLRIDVPAISSLHPAPCLHITDVFMSGEDALRTELVVDGAVVPAIASSSSDSGGATSVDMCWPDHDQDERGNILIASQCKAPLSSLTERWPTTYGPMRAIYSQPLTIVYGVPSDHELRLTLRDIAVYLANSNTVAHESTIRVMSDADFLTELESSSSSPPPSPSSASSTTSSDAEAATSGHVSPPFALLLVGGPLDNRVTRRLANGSETMIAEEGKIARGQSFDASDGRDDDDDDDQQHRRRHHRANEMPLRARFPLRLSGYANVSSSTAREFVIGGRRYTSKHASVLSLFPFQGRSGDNAAAKSEPQKRKKKMTEDSNAAHADTWSDVPSLGLVLSGNSVLAYQHALRLAWPTVPPMTRGPLVGLPDYVVVDEAIWRSGVAGIRQGGFYDADWTTGSSSSYRQ